jgi:hypothetical protein
MATSLRLSGMLVLVRVVEEGEIERDEGSWLAALGDALVDCPAFLVGRLRWSIWDAHLEAR